MTTKIRASGLSSYADCPRRSAAKLYAPLIKDAGFKIKEERANIGASTGTSTHAGCEHYLRSKMNKVEASKSVAEQQALESLDEMIENGVIWDDTTPNLNTAQKQVIRQVHAYKTFIVPEVDPVGVEEFFEFSAGNDIILTGHIDCRVPKGIRDTKTGVISRANGPQYGAYSLLCRSAGHEVSEIFEDYVPRVAIKKIQPEPTIRKFKPSDCEMAAYKILQRIGQDVENFKQDGNEWAFLPNPMSMLCSEKFCPSHGTNFCSAHKG